MWDKKIVIKYSKIEMTVLILNCQYTWITVSSTGNTVDYQLQPTVREVSCVNPSCYRVRWSFMAQFLTSLFKSGRPWPKPCYKEIVKWQGVVIVVTLDNIKVYVREVKYKETMVISTGSIIFKKERDNKLRGNSDQRWLHFLYQEQFPVTQPVKEIWEYL